MVDRYSPTINLIKTKAFIERVAVPRGVVRGRPA
jgi:hypothetical protein